MALVQFSIELSFFVCPAGKPADIIKNIDDFLPLDIELGESSSGPSSLQSVEILESLHTETTAEEIDSLLDEEFAETGSVRFSVYNSYFKAMGFFLVSAILLSFVLMQTSRNMSDWWLSYWVTATGNNSNSTNLTFHEEFPMLRYYWLFESQTSTDPLKYYFTTYGIFVGLNSLFTLFRAFLFAYGGIVAASKIHKSLLKSIMKVSAIMFKFEMNEIETNFKVKNRYYLHLIYFSTLCLARKANLT